MPGSVDTGTHCTCINSNCNSISIFSMNNKMSEYYML